MKALYHGPGKRTFAEASRPIIIDPTDAIVRVTSATICGTNLGTLCGDALPDARGLILGNEGIGVVESVGDDVTNFRAGDCVLISCLTSCGRCTHCQNGQYAHCENGGRILGSAIDGTCAEYVRVPFAERSLFPIPGAGDDGSDGSWIDEFTGEFMDDVSKRADRDAAVVIGGSVGVGPVLAVLQYYRDVVKPMIGRRSRLPNAPEGAQTGDRE